MADIYLRKTLTGFVPADEAGREVQVKSCTKCAVPKPLADFNRKRAAKDGRDSWCKSCQQAYDKARAFLPHRVEARALYQRTDIGREVGNRAKKAYIDRNPLKRAAHIAVGNAIKLGKLIKQPCEVCGNPKAEAHHDDYSKPLAVQWLCKPHHVEAHVRLEKA